MDTDAATQSVLISSNSILNVEPDSSAAISANASWQLCELRQIARGFRAGVQRLWPGVTAQCVRLHSVLRVSKPFPALVSA